MANKRFIPPKQETWQNCGGDAYRLAIVAYMQLPMATIDSTYNANPNEETEWSAHTCMMAKKSRPWLYQVKNAMKRQIQRTWLV